jgi:hypothetical protein
MLEKVLGVVEAHVSNVNYSTSSPTAIAADEIELFSVCLQRLLIVCCALSLRLYNEGVIEADAIHTRFNTLRQGVFCDLSSAAVRSETLNFFKYVVPVDTQGKYTSLLLAWLRDAIRKSAEYSLAAINVALCAVLPLLKKHSSEACKVRSTIFWTCLLSLQYSNAPFDLFRLAWTRRCSPSWTAAARAVQCRTPTHSAESRPGRAHSCRRMRARPSSRA